MVRVWGIIRKNWFKIIGVFVLLFGSLKDTILFFSGLLASHVPSITINVLGSLPVIFGIIGLSMIGIDIYWHRNKSTEGESLGIRKSVKFKQPDAAIVEMRGRFPLVFQLLESMPKDIYTESEYLNQLHTLKSQLEIAMLMESMGSRGRKVRVEFTRDIRRYALNELKGRRRYRVKWWVKLKEGLGF